MTRLPACTSLLALLALTSVASAKVIGNDDRRIPGEEDAGLLQSLGLIICNSVVDGERRRSAGTGTIVGSHRTILTSAHVLIDEAGRAGPEVRFDAVSDCTFRTYDESGQPALEFAFTEAAFGEFWYNAGAPNQDWAVLVTAEPLPDSVDPLPFAGNGNSIEQLDGLPIRMLAFHADLREARRTPLLSEGKLFGTNYGGFRRLAHDADSGRMSSGAAIVHRTADGQDVVVGVNRSSANLRDFNLAVPLTDELIQALRSHGFGQMPTRNELVAVAIR